MAVEEVGLNPEKLAAAIHRQLALTGGAVPVHQIAKALDIIEIREEPLTNLEGMLLTSPQRKNGSILVNSNSLFERRRFTVGHELGHFLITSHKPISDDGFRCASKDMISSGDFSDPHRRQEAEANRFAIALLAPAQLVRRFVSRSPDLAQVLAMAGELQVSKEAAARRYVELHGENLAAIFSKGGRVMYCATGKEFPTLALRKDDPLPADVRGIRQGQISDLDEVAATDWLRKPAGKDLCAQTLAQQNSYAITLLHAVASDDPGVEDTCDRFRR